MQFQVKTKKGIVRRNLRLVKTDQSKYLVIVDDSKEIGSVWKADGQVMKFRNHRLDGTKIVDRWFARTKEGKDLGKKSPYDEGFSTRLDALTELLEVVLKIRRNWK
jgi:hypothetical protein